MRGERREERGETVSGEWERGHDHLIGGQRQHDLARELRRVEQTVERQPAAVVHLHQRG